MSLIDWHQDYSINNKTVDDQHKKLLSMINRLHNAIVTDAVESEIAKVLDDLLDYTVYHFRYEEKLMEEINYPYINEHKKVHHELTKKVIEKRNEYLESKSITVFQLMAFLREWFIDHILPEDKNVEKYMRSQSQK